MNKPTAGQAGTQRLMLGIMAALLLWGIIHAIGAFVFGFGFWDLMKGFIVLGSVMLFLGFWWLALAQRKRRN